MSFTLNKLAWDSDFFDFSVGKIEGTLKNNSDLMLLESLTKSNGILLCYYSATQEIPSSFHKSKRLEFALVDKKVTYRKKINLKIGEMGPYVSAVNELENIKKLEDLAIQSGVYSRFNVDKRIEREKFEELYRLWMRNSINRTIAKEVLVYTIKGNIAGSVSLAEMHQTADIGIIAVDSSFRGKGIGKELMNSAERWFFKKGYKDIRVVTQGNNEAACKLYESCGYSLEGSELYYHVWKL